MKPDDGEIKYDKYLAKNTNKLVDKIINGKIEKITLEEKSKSPVKNGKR